MLNNYQRTILNDVEWQIYDKLQEYLYEEISDETIESIKHEAKQILVDADTLYKLNLGNIDIHADVNMGKVNVSWTGSNHLENFGD